MARRTALSRNRIISEINMTPLIDLTFLLLITFIITFPLIEQGIPVRLPKGKASELDQANTFTITLNDKAEMEHFFDIGVDMIYTDFAEPAEFAGRVG